MQNNGIKKCNSERSKQQKCRQKYKTKCKSDQRPTGQTWFPNNVRNRNKCKQNTPKIHFRPGTKTNMVLEQSCITCCIRFLEVSTQAAILTVSSHPAFHQLRSCLLQMPDGTKWPRHVCKLPRAWGARKFHEFNRGPTVPITPNHPISEQYHRENFTTAPSAIAAWLGLARALKDRN